MPIIPATRGCAAQRNRSSDVMREIDASRRRDSRRSRLTGVHLGSCGCDLTPPSSLIDLLRTRSPGSG